ncbi:MAG: type II toxin-antitoxin system PrlF family antitoxin [Methanobrevibacter sp.]|jgi:AbrB family looped-hinge helix DNA binding protein|nr:type II toxin-antitoxin system PrlF family antitoxin [Candidatus Methanoflexus mossambicus]
MLAVTKVYEKYQTVIPKEIRKLMNVEKDDIIEWNINSNGKIELNVRKKVDLEDINGIID